jgi:hypothetical protein
MFTDTVAGITEVLSDMDFKTKHGEIIMIKSVFTDGDKGDAEMYSKAIHKVKVAKAGQFTIESAEY